MERESEGGRPTEPPRPEEAKPGKDMPSDRDFKPSAETERVVEKKGQEQEPRDG